MNFDDFIKEGKARKNSRDKQLAVSLIKTADQDLLFINSWNVDETSARKVMSNYYDVLRSILEAIAALKGYKIYSHEAFTYFLKQENEELVAIKFDRFRKIRNRINYYGKNISPEEVKEHKEEIIKIIEKLKEKYFSH